MAYAFNELSPFLDLILQLPTGKSGELRPQPLLQESPKELRVPQFAAVPYGAKQDVDMVYDMAPANYGAFHDRQGVSRCAV
jgi:hypothetical protein